MSDKDRLKPKATLYHYREMLDKEVNEGFGHGACICGFVSDGMYGSWVISPRCPVDHHKGSIPDATGDDTGGQ